MKQTVLQERLGRLQAEYELSRRDLATVQQQLNALIVKEQEEAKKKVESQEKK